MMGKKSAERALKDNEAMAFAKHLPSSPRKLNLVAEMIRGLPCERALATLQFSPKRAAVDVRKVLQSAIANAENNHMLDVDRLIVAEASVGKSLVLKRWQARARGRVGHVQKMFSNIRVVLREVEDAD